VKPLSYVALYTVADEQHMGHAELFLVSANKSRRPGMQWSDDNYEVREGASDGPVVGRIYKLSVAPTGIFLALCFCLEPDATDARG
jgi:hypothetical protein